MDEKSKTSYAASYRNIDFRKYPEKYKMGKGEQGVLIAEPYKSEILPFWRFKTSEIAQISAEKIYHLFLEYKKKKEFVGMDMARKYLQMGFTRARRYANPSSGIKYQKGQELPQDLDSENSIKAQSATIFLKYYKLAKEDEEYILLMKEHKIRNEAGIKKEP